MTTSQDASPPSSSVPPGIDAGFWRRTAPPDLRSLFTDIIGYEERNPQTNRQVETASLTIPLILSFGDPFEIALGQHPTAENERPTFLAGLSSSPVFIQSNGRAKCLQINFTPIGARHFFRFPMDLLTDQMLPFADVAEPELAEFVRRIEDLTSWNARLDHALAYVIKRLRQDTVQLTPADHVLRRLLETGGQVSVTSLAKEIGWSRKHLAQKFRKDIGLRPKTVARVIRFGKVLKHAQNCCDIDWAGLAVDCGYADQAHLIRDFSEFSGQSPEAWRARLLNGTANTW